MGGGHLQRDLPDRRMDIGSDDGAPAAVSCAGGPTGSGALHMGVCAAGVGRHRPCRLPRIAYALGGLAAHPTLVGLGALSTAYTVTIFYMLMLDIWRLRYNKPLGIFGGMLLAAGIVRLVVMAFPQNQWRQIARRMTGASCATDCS